jgi:hypothetical protein
MYQLYCDDSGTHAASPIAVAAAYVSTERGWATFESQWRAICSREGLEYFHMTDFVASVANPEIKPYGDWDRGRRERVFSDFVRVINENKRAGFAVAVPKKAYARILKEQMPDAVREKFGDFHFTYAVRSLLLLVARWRKDSQITLPIHYTFDPVDRRAEKSEIEKPWLHDETIKTWGNLLGITFGGCAFKSKKNATPLQAADVLAWQHRDHMDRIVLKGRDDVKDCHPHYVALRNNQALNLTYYTEAQLRKNLAHELAVHEGRASMSYGTVNLFRS